MKTFTSWSISCGLALLMASLARGHGTPIDLRVEPQTQQLQAAASFTPGEFVDLGNFLISDQPGIGVLNASRGVAVGTLLNLEVTGPLLYWNGTELTPTSASIDLLAPNGGEGQYTIDANSGLQTGMQWDTYSGSIGWDADGTFFLAPGSTAGVYGVPVRVSSPSYVTSDPFVMVSEYDPNNDFTALDLEVIIGVMQTAIAPTVTGDYTGDGLVDEADFLRWRSEYGQSGTLSADGNGDQVVDAADYTVWRKALPATLAASATARAIPEPTTTMLASIASIATLFSSRLRAAE